MVRNIGYPVLVNDAANVTFVWHELMLLPTTGILYNFESQIEWLGASLFHYVHRHSESLPAKDVNNRNNYLYWDTIRGRKLLLTINRKS